MPISGRQAKDPQALFPALAGSACILALAGRAGEAQPILSELFGISVVAVGSLDEWSTDCVLAAEILGRRDEARRWLSTWRDSPWSIAARQLADQEFVAAAESLDSMGAARLAALARLRAAQELARTGRRAEADDQLSTPSDSSDPWTRHPSSARQRHCWPPRRNDRDVAPEPRLN